MGTKHGIPIEGRFWSHVAIGGADECWPWKLAPGIHGYGMFAVRHGKLVRPSRFAWTLTKGPIPDGLNALHSCDNPPCCNCRHLFLGTQLDNVKDMTKKGRRVDHLGEDHGRAVLNDASVIKIREMIAMGSSTSELSSKFGVASSTIWSIKAGQTWKHLIPAPHGLIGAGDQI